MVPTAPLAKSTTVAILVVGLESVTNMIVEPLVYGKGIGVSQAATLVMIAFWTWLWGPIGLLLTTPMTVCVLVASHHTPALSFLATLLGDEPALSPALGFYQRMGARQVGVVAPRPPRVTWSTHGAPFVAAVENGALWGTQFHPEKSGDAGAQLLTNWIGTL